MYVAFIYRSAYAMVDQRDVGIECYYNIPHLTESQLRSSLVSRLKEQWICKT
jgi:hypothetical protein